MNRPQPDAAQRASAPTHTCRTGLLAVVALLAASGGARAVQGGAFAPHRAPFGVRVVEPHTLAPAAGFGAAAHGRWNADALEDAAVLAGERAYALFNPGRWSAVLPLGTAPVRDLAALRRAAPGADGVVTAGAEGVVLWTFDEDARGFVATPVAGAWQAPERVAVAAFDEAWGLALLVVWDAATDALHPCVLFEGRTPDEERVLARLAPVPLPRAPLALALYDPDGTGATVIAVADALGLRTYSVAGALLGEVAAEADAGLLCAFDPGTSGTARRLAWLARRAADPLGRLRVVDAAGVEGPVGLAGSPGAGLAFGDFDRLGGQDLLLGVEQGGTARLLVNGCDAGAPPGPGGGGPQAVTFRPGGECELDLGAAGATTWPSRARPLFADFDLDGAADVLLFDDGDGAAHGFARRPQPPVPSAIEPVQLLVHGLDGGQGTLADPYLHLTLDEQALATRGASHAEVIVWPWWDLQPPQQLDGRIVGYQRRARGADGGWLEFHVPLDLGDARPLALGVEVRALRAGDEAVLDAVPYAVTEDCATFDALLELAPCADCQPPAGCDPALDDDPLGDYLGGLVPVPRLPPFGGDEQVPRVPPLPQ